jgi:hypothetical protein
MFFIYYKETIPGYPVDPIASPGGLQINIEKDGPHTIFQTRKTEEWVSKPLIRMYGKQRGYLYEDNGKTTENIPLFSKELFVNSNGYAFRIYTLTYSDDTTPQSETKAKSFHQTASKIINSFNFYK